MSELQSTRIVPHEQEHHDPPPHARNRRAPLERERDSPQEQDRRIDRALLGLLLGAGTGAWSLDDLERELGGPGPVTADSVERLRRAGLLHRCGQLVLPTRAAAVFDEISG